MPPRRWQASTYSSRAAAAASAEPRRSGSRRWAPGSQLPAVTRCAPRPPRRRSGAATGNPDVDTFTADLSSQAEVRRLAAEVLAAYPRLDALVNNVGGYWATRHVTVDGLEHTFAVNHLAAFLLTELLLDRLKASAPARVVDRVLQCAVHGQDRLRRPAGRASVLRSEGLQPVEAGQRDVHLRARPTAGWLRRDGHRVASWRGEQRVRLPRIPRASSRSSSRSGDRS